MKRHTLVILFLGLSFSAQIARADWSVVKKLTGTPGESWYPAIAVDPYNNLHVVWFDDTSQNWDIYYKKGK